MAEDGWPTERRELSERQLGARAAHERAGARGLAQGEILPREPQRSPGIAADREPEFRGELYGREVIPRVRDLIAGPIVIR